MKRYLLLTLLITTNFLLAQGKTLSIKEIDSICESNGRYGIADGVIEIKNNKKEKIGSGGSSTTTYLNYYNQEQYNKLTREEKKKYNREKDSELIRGDFNQNISYNNNINESIFAQFYYYKNHPFYLKLKITKSEGNKKDIVLTYSLNQAEIESEKEIKNELGLELRKWINEKNLEILEFYNLP